LPDVFDTAARSAVMSKACSKGNKSTEMRLIEVFAAQEIKGWRRNYRVKGRPDSVFLKKRIAVFVDGCFWHGYACRNTRPKQNEGYWKAKRERNIARDRSVAELFERRGWIVLCIWACELKKKNFPALVVKLERLYETRQ
jgi:DNA mismatch endonuclease (patch repair protein)